jgi:hypothetical protein
MEIEKDRTRVTMVEEDRMSAMEAAVTVDGVSIGDVIVNAEMIVEEAANVTISSVAQGLVPMISTGDQVEESPVKVTKTAVFFFNIFLLCSFIYCIIFYYHIIK